MFSKRSVWVQFEGYWQVDSVIGLEFTGFLNDETNCTPEHQQIIMELARIFIRRMACIKVNEILSAPNHYTVLLREEQTRTSTKIELLEEELERLKYRQPSTGPSVPQFDVSSQM